MAIVHVSHANTIPIEKIDYQSKVVVAIDFEKEEILIIISSFPLSFPYILTTLSQGTKWCQMPTSHTSTIMNFNTEQIKDGDFSLVPTFDDLAALVMLLPCRVLQHV